MGFADVICWCGDDCCEAREDPEHGLYYRCGFCSCHLPVVDDIMPWEDATWD